MNENNNNFTKNEMLFTQISSSFLKDTSISLKAKGLYSLMQNSMDNENTNFSKENLMSVCKEGKQAFNSAWKELKEKGYLKQYRVPKGKNDSFVYEYKLLHEANTTTPSLINLNKNGEIIS